MRPDTKKSKPKGTITKVFRGLCSQFNMASTYELRLVVGRLD